MVVRVGDELFDGSIRSRLEQAREAWGRLPASSAEREGARDQDCELDRSRPDDIAAALKKHVESFRPTVTREEVGRVTETGDGIARVEGMPSTMALELLEFPGGLLGMALNLDVREIGCVVFGDASGIEEGDEVKHTGRVLSVPVGDGFLGRVDPLGRPLDGKGDIEAETTRALELQAPTVVQRQPVKEPLETGIKAIDAMTNIGRGQRELIIGDQKTGKSAVCLDTIINQRQHWGTDKQVKCIYVAIGQKATTVREFVGALEENGALEYTVVVSAPADLPASFKYIAPYAGSAMGQHWMYKGEHALIVFDDLSKQAEAYREISLLLRRPAGREAYPATCSTSTRGCWSAAPSCRRPGRRLADRPADHRDQGQRHLGLHDQRHLHHRRPDLPGGRPVQPGRPAGHQRRHLGLPGRRQRPDQGHAPGRGHPAHRPGPVPGPGGVRPVRLRDLDKASRTS